MLELLSERLQKVFQRLKGKGKLTEKDVDEALREVRLALLEADVHFKVARDFVARVREKAISAEVLESLTPGQQVAKIAHQELTSLLGGSQAGIALASQPPTIIMLVGLHGSGKTTTAAKLALHFRRSGQRPLLVAADIYRPAAKEQLIALGRQLDIPVYGEGSAPVELCLAALKRARELAATVVLADTAGRLSIDEEMMRELTQIKEKVHPHEVLLVADAMTGQDAVRTAEAFHSQVGLTGLILTKMDGDARGGAALSIRSVTGVPIKFLGTGEKTDALEPFYPDRLASRILGMGDMLTLIEKAQATFDQQKAQEMEKKLRRAQFDLDDFLVQLREMRKMGPLSQILEMIPGLGGLSKQIPAAALDEKQVKKVEALILSMTPRERRQPSVIDGSRRRRIARGSGTTPQDVNRLLNQFGEMQRLMKQMASSKGRFPFPR
ncbi:MAG: signal recognition particle protein [Chloroflexota bacterium]|nr:signal recognition particle protein [Chloroflexota bacterium]